MNDMGVRRIALPVLALGVLISSPLCLAQSDRPEALVQGSIIIMQRDTPDPIFRHSVILLARYDKSGTVGLMIHHRSDIPIQKALAGIAGAEKRTDPMFIGGPVQLESVMALLRSGSPPAAAARVAGKSYLVISKEGLTKALSQGRDQSELRIYLGYAGWAPGQLESEVRRGGWWIFNYDESLVFDEHPETLWERLIKHTEVQRISFPVWR